jgi:hypothetical protein
MVGAGEQGFDSVCLARRIATLSAATTTRPARDCFARSATRTTIGLPAMSASGLFGSRVEVSRAGIRTV